MQNKIRALNHIKRCSTSHIMTEGQIKTTQDTIFYLAGWQKKIRKADTIYGQYCKETDTFIT